jgi:hypothetical protein
VIVEDGPLNSALGASVETKHYSAPGTGLSGKTKSKRQPWEEQGSGKGQGICSNLQPGSSRKTQL